jgi:hypothetical protein
VIASPGLYSFDTRHAKSQPAPLCTPRAGGAIAVRKQPTGERRRQTGRRGMEGVRSGHRRAILGRAVLQRPLQGFLQPGGRPSGAGRRRVCALVGRGQSERINPDGAITGLPSLHATVATADRKRFLAYWQGQSMLGRLEYLTQWVKMSGVSRSRKERVTCTCDSVRPSAETFRTMDPRHVSQTFECCSLRPRKQRGSSWSDIAETIAIRGPLWKRAG